METWSLIFTILSFIVACFSLGAMIKIAVSTNRLENTRSNLFNEMLVVLKSMVPKKDIQNEKATIENKIDKETKKQEKNELLNQGEKIKELYKNKTVDQKNKKK